MGIKEKSLRYLHGKKSIKLDACHPRPERQQWEWSPIEDYRHQHLRHLTEVQEKDARHSFLNTVAGTLQRQLISSSKSKPLLPYSVLLSEIPGEDVSWFGSLWIESIPGPINFDHVRKWTSQMKVEAFQKEKKELGMNPGEVC